MPMPGLKDLLRGDFDILEGLDDLGDLERSRLYGECEDLRLGEERGETGLLDPEECNDVLSYSRGDLSLDRGERTVRLESELGPSL